LTQQHDQLLRQERSLLEDLRVQLARLDAPEDDLLLLKRSLQQLDELFLLVVVGEFNAGKTAFLNALLGSRLLTEGVTPTTSHIHLLRYGKELSQEPFAEEFLKIQVPVDWLQEINLVDTPGTNAVIQRHQQLTEHFVPRSDLILFVTSADRPFSESERTFLEQIRGWGKKIIIVVNKMDLIEDADDRDQVLSFVDDNARQLLDAQPEIFPVSARLALRSKELAADNSGSPTAEMATAAEHFEALESYILERLDARERIRLKLENPLGIATRMIERYSGLISDRQQLLREDFETLDIIDEQLVAYEEDMRRDFTYHLSHVDNVLYEMAERGDRFFDDTLRFTRIFDLVNGEKVRGEFEREVVADTSRQIEQHVNELIDWMVERDYRQWRDVMEYLDQRSAQHADRIVGQVNSNFEFNRQTLLSSVGKDAQKVVEGYDREAESLKLAQEVQRALFQTAAVEVGALGLGALLVAILQTTMLDVTGILGASAIAAMGLYVLPYRRSKIKAQLREQINELRSQLHEALQNQFETEIQDSAQRIREAIAPYTRFVRVEREKLDTLDTALGNARLDVSALRSEVDRLSQT
jgi:small GTP-binding protein